MQEIVFKGKINVPSDEDLFLKDFDELLEKHRASFTGSVQVYQFDDCEIISDGETGN